MFCKWVDLFGHVVLWAEKMATFPADSMKLMHSPKEYILRIIYFSEKSLNISNLKEFKKNVMFHTI